MKYKIKINEIGIKSLKSIVLENRDLTKDDLEFLKNPTNEYVNMPLAIENMDKAMVLFMNELNKESKIGIIKDPDVDGDTSTALMYLFLVNECQVPKEQIEIFYHESKQHGLSDEKLYKQIKKSDIEFLIIPDAGSNEVKEIKELLKQGKRVLVLDHHNIEDKEQNRAFENQDGELIGVIVNNQINEESSALSGVGVVYKFLVALTEDELEHYMDLVAIGNVADSMNINDLELRYIVNKGLANVNNDFIKEMFNEEETTPTDVSFNIANKMNAVNRYGKKEEKIDMFRALIGEKDDREYKPRKSAKNPNPQIEIRSLQKTMARVCGNVKTRQDKAVKESMKKVEQYIIDNNCCDHKVILIINDKKGKESLVERSIGGLVANKLIDKYNRPVMIIHKTKDEYSGSMRGKGVESFKEILENTGIVTAKGHNNSAGVFVDKSDMSRLMKKLDEAMGDINIEAYDYEIDCVLSLNDLKKKDFDDIYDMRKIWFSDCKEPLFLIKDIEIDEKDIRIPYATLISFTHDGYKFDKNYCSGDFLDRILFRKEKTFGRRTYKFDIVVKLSKNEFNKNGFFEVVDIESQIVNKKNKTKNNDNCPF